MHRNAFSLVELLAVIAIVAVLLAVLIPALSQTRESARRAACGANHKSLTTALFTSAGDYRGKVPLGHWVVKQFNYPVYISTPTQHGFGPLGVLYAEGYLDDPQWLVDPSSEQETFARLGDVRRDPSLAETGFNQWPIRFAKDSPSANTRTSYGARPMVSTHTGRTPVTVAEQLPRVALSRFVGKVILADIVSRPENVEQTHGTGVTTTRGDGAVHWVQREVFDENLEQLRDTRFDSDNDDLMLSDDGSSGIFADLDAAP
jgi:prepilin-type N-terminal cleavage/methylation domain-containing protein